MPPVASLVAWVLVGPVQGAGQGCAATPWIAEAEAKVPPGETTRKLRAWLGYARGEALAAEREDDAARCVRVVRELAARAGELEALVGKATADRVRAEADRIQAEEARRARAEDAARRAATAPPPATPEQQWKRRRGRLVANVAASACFTLIGLTLATVPWIAHAAACRSSSDCEPLGAIFSTVIGAPVLVAAGIPLAVWSVRLHRHRKQRPVIARLGGSGLRLEF